MISGDVAQWGATGIIFVGVLYTFFKNGTVQKTRDIKLAKEQAIRETKTQDKLDAIDEAIKSPEYGLMALKEDMFDIKSNCAAVTSGFTERLKTLEKPGRR